jgi:hypothetical protein
MEIITKKVQVKIPAMGWKRQYSFFQLLKVGISGMGKLNVLAEWENRLI